VSLPWKEPSVADASIAAMILTNSIAQQLAPCQEVIGDVVLPTLGSETEPGVLSSEDQFKR
jgi:hypothetical protein